MSGIADQEMVCVDGHVQPQTAVDQQPYLIFHENEQKVISARGQVMLATAEATPKDYLCISIITCLFCCCPIGSIAIIKSLEVRSAVQSGNMPLAKEASSAAVRMNVAAVVYGVGIAAMILFLSFMRYINYKYY
ncbi:uncharacterized protein LOC144348059 [Saccoglossus kowalevskii]